MKLALSSGSCFFYESEFDAPITKRQAKRYISIRFNATPIFCAVLDDIASTMLNRRFVEELFLRHQGPAMNEVRFQIFVI